MISRRQKEFLKAKKARINVLDGSVRSGKTHILNHQAVWLTHYGPKGKGAIVAKTLETLRQNILDPMRAMLGDSFEYTDGGRRIRIGPKTDIRGIGANDEKSKDKIQGDTIAWAVGDEVVLWPKTFFEMMLTRLSVKGAQLYVSCNPDSPFHWLKKDYIDREDEIDLKRFHFTIDENPFLDPDYVEALKAELTGVWYQRYILGLWVLAEGVIYSNLTDDHFQDLSGKKYQSHIVGIDYGTSNPTVFLDIGFNSVYDIGIVDEYYYDSRSTGRQKTDNEYGNDFDEWAKDKAIDCIYCDPSAASFIQELRRRGWPVLPAENDVLDGIRYVSKKIQLNHLAIDPMRCPRTKQEIQTYSWDPSAQKRGEDKPLKEHDHCFAAGTMIETINGAIPVEDVDVGDFVLTSQGFKPVSSSGITSNSSTVYDFKMPNGKTLTSTKGHPVWTENKGFELISKIKKGDVLIKAYGIIGSNVIAKEDIVGTNKRKSTVYNLTVDDCPEFFANGVLVHNCPDAFRYPLFSRFGKFGETIVA